MLDLPVQGDAPSLAVVGQQGHQRQRLGQRAVWWHFFPVGRNTADLASCSYGHRGPQETFSMLTQFPEARFPTTRGKEPGGAVHVLLEGGEHQ